MAYRLLKMLIFVIVSIILITIALSVWLVSTTEGNRELSFLATLIEPRLEMNIYGGNLIDGIAAHELSWTDEYVSVTASQVSSEWNPACFLKRTLCAKKVYLDTLTVKTRPKNTIQRVGEIQIPELNLPVNLTLSDLQVGKLIIDYSDSAPPIEISSLKMSALSRAKQVEVTRLTARYKNIVATTKGDIDLSGKITLKLALTAIVKDVFDGHELVLDAGVNGSLDSLRIAGTSAGAFESTYISNVNTLAANLPSKARISWKNAGWPLSDHHIAKSTDGTLFIDGNINQFALEFDSLVSGKDIPQAEIKLTGTLLTLQGINAEKVEVNTLNGQITGNASVNWSNWQHSLGWTSQLSFSGVDPSVYKPGYPGNLAGTVFAEGTLNRDKSWTLGLKPAVVQGTLNEQAFHAHAILLRSDKAEWDIESLRLISKDNEFNISGTVDNKWAMQGELQLSKLQQLIPGASGSISGTIALSGPALEPISDFDISSKQLMWRDNRAEDIVLSGRINDFFNKNSNVKLDAKKFTIDNRKIGELDLEFTGNKKLHNIKLDAQSLNRISASMSLTGELLNNYDWKGHLTSSTLKLPEHDLNLVSATALSYERSKSSLMVSPHCWSNRDTYICLNNTLNASKNGRAEISLSRYSMHQLNSFLPENMKLFGKSKADITVDWGEQIQTGLRVIVNAEVSDGYLALESPDAEDLQLAYNKVNIDTFFDRGDIRTNISFDSNNFGDGDVSFSIKPDEKPLSFTRGTLKLSNLDIGFLQSFLPDFQTIEGIISADGKITGTIANPAFIGDIKLSQPILKSDKLPLQITGGNIIAAIAGRKANITGTVKSGNGSIKLYGEADWENLTAWSLIVNAQGDALVINQKPLYESVIAPNLAVSIKPNQVNVGGNIKIVAAAINIKEIPEGATNLSSDIVLAESNVEEVLTESKWNVVSDITIILGDAVRLSGYGMRAQLKGDFRVVKNDNKPLLLFGEIEIPKGIYKSYGQDLKVDDGQIILVGPINQTTLNIDAYREVEEVTAGLHLSGTVEKPLVTLYSDPFLEQERVLAYIVLGRDIAAGDNNDSNILATAALSMGISNGRGLATDIAEAFGIREFNIEASGRGEDTQVLLSGRLSKKLLIRYGVGVFTPVNTLYLRYDLSKKLYLETAQGLERAADLIYSFEF